MSTYQPPNASQAHRTYFPERAMALVADKVVHARVAWALTLRDLYRHTPQADESLAGRHPDSWVVALEFDGRSSPPPKPLVFDRQDELQRMALAFGVREAHEMTGRNVLAFLSAGSYVGFGKV